MAPRRQRAAHRRLPATALILCLALLLALAAALQFHWIGQVSRAERQQLESALELDATALAEHFDRELTLLYLAFRRPIDGNQNARTEPLTAQAVQQRWREWEQRAQWPALLKEICLTRLRPRSKDDLLRLRKGEQQWTTEAWPSALEGLHRAIFIEQPRSRRRGTGPVTLPVVAEDPALLIPVAPVASRIGVGLRERRARGRRAPPSSPPDLLILRLDREAISSSILPELYERHFSPRSRQFGVVVRQIDGDSVLFSSAGNGSTHQHDDEASTVATLFSIRPQLLSRSGAGTEQAPPTDDALFAGLAGEPNQSGAFALVAEQRNSSLDRAVARTRRRNLSISLGTLALLAASMILVLLNARRTQRLAQRQLDFVAGITHELHTPLAAIQSAGQNLADGLIDDRQRVRDYGALVNREGRRLSTLVAQALELAEVESGQVLNVGPVQLDRAIDAAIDSCRWLIDQRQARVTTELQPGLPAVRADRGALARVLDNLLINALKHGRENGNIEITARADRQLGRIELQIGDDGPGIAGADLEHIYEPFYRGRATRSRTPGSGLGLHLVRRLLDSFGGSVAIESTTDSDNSGTRVTVLLPIDRSDEASA